MISTPYDHIAAEFRAARSTLHAKEAEYLALVLEPLAPGSRVLDLGCGTGHPIATAIAARGHHVVGVDASAAMLAAARETLPDHRWIHGLIETIELDDTFDAAVCWDALFHLPRERWAAVIAKIHAWLRPHGRFMLSSGGVVDPAGAGFVDTMFGHEFYYDSLPPGALAAALNDAGFAIVLSEMCSEPDGGRDKGKWATIASRRA